MTNNGLVIDAMNEKLLIFFPRWIYWANYMSLRSLLTEFFGHIFADGAENVVQPGLKYQSVCVE